MKKPICRDPKAEKMPGWQSFNGGQHLRRTVYGKNLDFWPSTGKWFFNGQYRLGNLYNFLQQAEKGAQAHALPQPVKKRVISREQMETYQDDLIEAKELYYYGKKESVAVYIEHLQAKIKKCEVAG